MTHDFAVIGAGIAGASVAAELAAHGSVLLLEAEATPGYHSTGRSAAFWHETLGGPEVRRLSVASYPALHEGGFLSPRTCLNVADADHLLLVDALLDRFAGSGAALRRVGRDEILARVPRARPELLAGVLEESCADIDVAALHGRYLKTFKARGGELTTDARLDRLERDGDAWRVGEQRAKLVVNAAGAWADQVAKLAGAAPLGLQPMRRTIAQVRVTSADVPAALPLTMDVAGRYYFRPDGPDRLWLCPHDETPVDPHDVAPEEIDVATAIHWFETVTDWRVAAVERKWAGLRTFAPDRLPVFGFDPQTEGLFWCAGQGGTGIQTSPAAAALCAALITRSPLPEWLSEIEPAPFSPARFI